jgi:hypothetical protein
MSLNSRHILFRYTEYNQLNRIISNIIDTQQNNDIYDILSYYYKDFDIKLCSFSEINRIDLDKEMNEEQMFFVIKNPELTLMYRYKEEKNKEEKNKFRYYTINLKTNEVSENSNFSFRILSTKDVFHSNRKELKESSVKDIKMYYEYIISRNTLINFQKKESNSKAVPFPYSKPSSFKQSLPFIRSQQA